MDSASFRSPSYCFFNSAFAPFFIISSSACFLRRSAKVPLAFLGPRSFLTLTGAMASGIDPFAAFAAFGALMATLGLAIKPFFTVDDGLAFATLGLDTLAFGTFFASGTINLLSSEFKYRKHLMIP